MYRGLRIAVVVPAYDEARLLPRTLETMPALVDRVWVVDDASRDETAAVARRCAASDARIRVRVHASNGGVGAAIASGYRAAIDEPDIDAVAVMAADAQMDPTDLPGLLDGLIDDDADYAKGDRLAWPGARRQMPTVRWAGTLILGWLTRVPSGFGELRDSQCGYTVARADLLRRIPLDALYPRYGFPNDMLARVGEAGGTLSQRPVKPVYADETSGLRPARVAVPIARILAAGTWRRVRRTLGRRSPHSALWMVLLAVGLGFLAGYHQPSVAADEPATTPASGVVVDGLAVDPEIVDRIRQPVELIDTHWVDEPDIALLGYEAAAGAVATLDSNSRFLPPRAYRVWSDRLHGRATGPGFDIRLGEAGVVIVRVSPDSPAADEGVEMGDLLLEIDGESVANLSAYELRTRLRGDEDTEVNVRIERPGRGRTEARDLTLVRKKVRAVRVVSQMLPDGVAYFEVRSFLDGTARDLAADIERLTDAHGAPLRGIVIDLRYNLGGLLEEALAMADLFLGRDLEVVSLARRGETLKVHRTWTEPLFGATPVVFVVNRRSASASELLAAALQDHGRATVVGSSTYGKGSVQSTYPLADGSGLKITTSRYVTPAGRTIDKIGIAPDVVVEDDTTPDTVVHVLEHDRALQAAYDAVSGEVQTATGEAESGP